MRVLMRVVSGPLAFAAFPAISVLVAPRAVAAQDWPSGGVVVGAGFSSLDSKGAFGLSGGVTRRWGPLVGTILGNVAVNTYGGHGLSATVRINGDVYCGNRRVTTTTDVVCPAHVDAVGGLATEAGLTIAPRVPIIVGVGYRAGPVSESYLAASVFGGTGHEAVSWLAHVAVGRHAIQVHAGFVFDLDLLVP